MKLLLSIIGLAGVAVSVFGQSKIRGRIKDNTEYLPSVNILLMRDSNTMNAAVTDDLGNFSMDHVAPGHYQLSASMVGYNAHTSFLTIEGGQLDITIPDIVLEPASVALNEVVVESQKQLLDQKMDRMVINLSGSITAAGNTILEILQKSPGVVVNKQLRTIAVNGKSGVRIMINGKVIQVPADVALQMLDGMSAANVEKIELITTPPSNYDADGSGGIIHIVTKENIDYGTRSSLGCTAGAHWAETLGGNFNINHRTDKAAYFFDYSILRNHNLHRMNMQRRALILDHRETVFDNSRRENVTTQQNISMGAEWSLSDRTMINVLFTGYRSNWEMDAVAHNTNQFSPDSTKKTNMEVWESNVWQSAMASVGLQHSLTKKSKIDFTLDYLFYHNNNPSDYHGDRDEDSNIDLSKTTPIHFLVGTANYHRTASHSFSWDAGLKAVVSSLNNDVYVRRLQAGEWVIDSAFTSNSTLHERVFAAYLSTRWQMGQWQINSGVRYEYTNTLITSGVKEDVVRRKYGYLFPTVSVKRKLSSGTELQFSYARRLTRPTYNDMAPYVFFWGPNSFSAGNTSLYPALSDAVTTGLQRGQWTISLQYTHTRKEIVAMQPELDNQLNTLTYRSQNLKSLNTLGLSSSYALTITPWWETQATVVAQHQAARTAQLLRNETFSLYGVNVNLMSVMKLPRDFSIEVSGTYQSRLLSGVSSFLPFGSLNAGVQKKLGQKGTLRLSMDDILSTNSWRIRTVSATNNLDVRFNYDFHNQFVRLTYTWSLGNTKLRSVKVKSGSEEERKRVNN